MKNIPFLTLISVLLSFCFSFNLSAQPKRFIPKGKVFKGIHFGMTETDFLKRTTKYEKEKEKETSHSFRSVYKLITGKEEPAEVVYYFDKDGEKPLYEIIIIYPTAEKAERVGDKLFGKRNYADGKEWFFEDAKPYPIAAWNYKSKLIITALIPDTEWYEDSQYQK